MLPSSQASAARLHNDEDVWKRPHLKLQSAGLLSLFSILILVDGATKTTFLTIPGTDWMGSEAMFPLAAVLAATLSEVVLGLVGVAHGLLVLAFDHENIKFSGSFFSLQAILGLYVFTVFAFAQPIFTVVNSPALPLIEGFNRELMAAMGIFGSVAYYGALFAGQLFHAMRLYSLQRSDVPFPGTVFGLNFMRLRLLAASSLAVLAGLAQLITGSEVTANTDSVAIDPIPLGPIIITSPQMIIVSGILLLLYGGLGLYHGSKLAESETPYLTWFTAAGITSFVTQVTFLVLAQASDTPGIVAQSAGTVVILSFALSFLPAYFDHEARMVATYEAKPKQGPAQPAA